QVHGNWYGAPLDQIRDALTEGTDVLLKIDVQGAIQVRRRIPQAVFVFLAPASVDDLLERLRARHTESPEELERRVRDARFEMEQMRQYDYCVVNREDDLDQAVSDVACIISAERLRTNRQPIDLSAR
ncbi:MAG TPA: guanylate kinase, partial [Chloroflexota bacterium]